MAAPEHVVKLADGRGVVPALIGGSITSKEPALSASGLRLFTPCCTSVLCFSVRTAQQIGSLKHSAEVTAVCAGASRAECAEPLATGTRSGMVQLWDTKTFTRLSTLDVEGPIVAMRWPRPERLLIVVGANGKPAKVVQVELPVLDEPQRVEANGSLKVCSFTGFDAVDDVVAMSSGKELVVWMEGWSQSCTHNLRRTVHRPTAVSIDPSRRYVAVGTATGEIWLCWDLFDERRWANGEQVKPAKLHWHRDSVMALSHCGPLLLSGGLEGVLCKWNTDEMTPAFVPRLGGGVLHVTCSGSGRCCVSLLNNSILICDNLASGNATLRYIDGIDVPLPLKRYETQSKDAPISVQEAPVLHPLQDGFSAITCSGRRVHFFDSRQGSLVATAKMALGQTNVGEDFSRARWVLHSIAFSPDASSIMTFEARVSPALERFDVAASRSGVLKWWRRTGENDYALDTVSNNVHGAEISVALALPLREGLFVTGSLDGCFKCWEYLPLNKEDQSCWQCISGGGWRAKPIKSGCCSADGSTLALGYAGAIVLWDPDTAVELNVLALDDSAHEAVHLFCMVACGRFMLAAHVKGRGLEEVVCWDLASFDVASRVDLRGALPGGGLTMLRSSAPMHASGDLRLLAYRPPGSEKPATSGGHLCLWTLARGAADFAVEAAASLPAGRTLLDISFLGHGSRLMCWTSSLELWDFDLTAPSRDAQDKAPHEEVEEAIVGRGKIARVLGQRTTNTDATADLAKTSLLNLPLRTTAAQQVGLVPHLLERVLPANAPSHMLPPPSSIWAGVLSVWGKRWPDSQGASAESQHGTRAEVTNEEAESSNLIFKDDDVPSWARTGSELPPAGSSRSELVDFQFMERLLKDAAESRRK